MLRERTDSEVWGLNNKMGVRCYLINWGRSGGELVWQRRLGWAGYVKLEMPRRHISEEWRKQFDI